MRLFADDVVNFPKERVYLTQRDAMPNLVAYLPNVEWIKVLEREDLVGGARILNLWKGADSDVPRLLRPFVKPEVMQWKDHAQWSDADHHVDWRLEVGIFTEQVDIRGRTTFTDAGADKCRVLLDGNLIIDQKSLPGVPKLLASKVVGEVEKFIVKLLTPNLTAVNRGIEVYLSKQG